MYHGAFPNMYTLRGTRPRWALDYVESLDLIASLNPDIVAGSHLDPLYGQNALDTMQSYRDAILYVHDATVQGMNAGKSPYQLMDEVELPPALSLPDLYGTVPWSVRGIYEGYIGFFDENVATMYSTSPEATYPELVTLAGGAPTVAGRAADLVLAADYPLALRVADAALAVDADDLVALGAKLDAITALLAAAANINEIGWLAAEQIDTQARIDELTP